MTTDINSNSLSKARRRCAGFLILANLALVVGLGLISNTQQDITSPLALTLSLLWICAISIASATVIVIVGYQEISPELKRLRAIEKDWNLRMAQSLFRGSNLTTSPPSERAKN